MFLESVRTQNIAITTRYVERKSMWAAITTKYTRGDFRIKMLQTLMKKEGISFLIKNNTYLITARVIGIDSLLWENSYDKVYFHTKIQVTKVEEAIMPEVIVK